MSAEADSAESSPSAAPWREAMVLAGIGALVFVGALDNGFVNWDDGLYIESNVLVAEPSAHALSDHLLTPELGYPLPLPVAIYRALWDGSGSAWPFHLASVLVHALNVALLAAVLRTQLADAKWAVRIAVLAFAVHPIVVEPVVWATGLKDLLAGFGALLAVAALQRCRPLGVVLALCVGVASKPVAGLVGLALLAGWLRRPKGASGSAAMTPVLGTLAALGVAWLAFTVAQEPPELRTSLQEWTSATRVFGALGTHVSHVVVPAGLSPWYPVESVSVVEVVLGAITMGGALWLGWRWLRQRDPRWQWWALGVAVYLPASNLKPLIRFTADSYVYVTWACAMAIAAHAWANHGDELVRRADRVGRVVRYAGAAFVLAWIPVSVIQVETWKDTLSLWGSAWSQYPDDGTLVYRYGDALGRAGRNEEELALYIEHLDALRGSSKVPPALVLWFEHEEDFDSCDQWYARGFDSEVEQDHGFYWHYVEYVGRYPQRHRPEHDFGLKHALSVYAADPSKTRLSGAQLDRLADAAVRLGAPEIGDALRLGTGAVVRSHD